MSVVALGVLTIKDWGKLLACAEKFKPSWVAFVGEPLVCDVTLDVAIANHADSLFLYLARDDEFNSSAYMPIYT